MKPYIRKCVDVKANSNVERERPLPMRYAECDDSLREMIVICHRGPKSSLVRAEALFIG